MTSRPHIIIFRQPVDTNVCVVASLFNIYLKFTWEVLARAFGFTYMLPIIEAMSHLDPVISL
jgi:hypothetical protein